MNKNSKQRDSNYELLRTLAGMAVVVLHYNYHPSGGGALTTARGVDYYFLMFMQILCVCAVNIFILLSGYFGYKTNSIKTSKLVKLLLQTMLFGFAFCVLFSAKQGSWSIRALVASLIPANYFVVLYIVLMIFAPSINKLIYELDKKKFSLIVALAFLVFSVYSTGVDILKEVTGLSWNGLSSVGLEGSMAGYTIVNFTLVYLLGVWLRLDGRIVRVKTNHLLLALLGNLVAIALWRDILPETAWMYNNPLIITEGIIVFSLFGKIQIQNAFINTIAPAAFTCFLIHGYLLSALDSLIKTDNQQPLLVIELLLTVIIIYSTSFVAMKAWEIITTPLFKDSIDKIPSIEIW